MKRIIFLFLILTIGFSSCKKDDPNPDPDPIPQDSVLDYFPLNVGNYWVYERSGCDSTWTDCNLITTDTVEITKDTIINDKVYFKIEGTFNLNYNTPAYLRDSLDYIISHTGNIYFSNTDFTTLLNEKYIVNQDTLYYWYTKMQEDKFEITLPAGTFNCLDKKLSFFRHQENFEHEFNTHNLYAKNIGPVYNNWMYASSTAGIKHELINYNINYPICDKK